MAVKYGTVIDTSRCFGCRTCMVACKMEHNIPVGTFRTKVLNSKGTIEWDAYEGTFSNVTLTFMTSMCQQCDSPACAEVCPTGATIKRDDGIVYVDETLCIGCQSCELACPYDARSINTETGIEEKCTMCMERLDNGEVPMCMFCCPVQAIVIGDLNNPESEVSKKLADNEVYQRFVEFGTGPNTYYI
jgi:Fe-S-cluster-containing dehydrogenase component